MTFYHCLFGGYGPVGPMAGVGHVGAAFIRRRSPIIPSLPPAFPLGSQGVQATIFKKTIFVCSPGAAVENAQFFRFVKKKTISISNPIFSSNFKDGTPFMCLRYPI